MAAPCAGFTDVEVGAFSPNEVGGVGEVSRGWGPSNFLREHTFILSGFYRAPFGVNVSGIWRLQSGNPWGPEINGDINGDEANANDLAYLFDPDDPATPAAVAEGMRRVLANQDALDRAKALFPQARTFKDFRRVFDHANEFDAVAVSTAEHTHAFATLPALQLKKHVYCEKPLTYNVHEARVIRETAARMGVVTQMGTQIHAGDNYRRVVEHIQVVRRRLGHAGISPTCPAWHSWARRPGRRAATPDTLRRVRRTAPSPVARPRDSADGRSGPCQDTAHLRLGRPARQRARRRGRSPHRTPGAVP